MRKHFYFLFAMVLCVQVQGQHQIYPNSPRVVTLWHRLADFSHRLRSVEACEFSPDGRLAVSGAKFGYGVMLWRVADGALLWETHHDSEVECVTFSPDGKRVATAGEDFTLRIWDIATGSQLHVFRTASAGFDGIAWSPDGKLIVGGDEQGDAVFIDGDDYREIFRVNCGSTINSLHFSADGSQVLVGGNMQTPDPNGPGGNRYEGFVKTISVVSRKIITSSALLPGSIKSVRWSPDGRTCAAAGFDRTVRLFSADSLREVRKIDQPLKVEAVAYSPDGQFLLTGGHEEFIRWYRLRDGALVLKQPAARTEYLDFSHDGRLLLSGHEDSGLLSCHLLLSDVQALDNYQQIADEQLDNKDLKPTKNKQ